MRRLGSVLRGWPFLHLQAPTSHDTCGHPRGLNHETDQEHDGSHTEGYACQGRPARNCQSDQSWGNEWLCKDRGLEVNISINSNSLIPLFSTLVQRALIAALAYFGATGFVSDDDIAKIASAVVAVALVIYGAVKSYMSNEDKKTLNAS